MLSYIKYRILEKISVFLKNAAKKTQNQLDLDQLLAIFFKKIPKPDKDEGRILLLKKGQHFEIRKTVFPKNLKELEKTYRGLTLDLERSPILRRSLQENQEIRFENPMNIPHPPQSDVLFYRFELLKPEQIIYIPFSEKNKEPIGVLILFKLKGSFRFSLKKVKNWIHKFYPILLESLKQQEKIEDQKGLQLRKEKYKRLFQLSSQLNLLLSPEKVYQSLINELMDLFGFEIGIVQLEKDGKLPFVTGSASTLENHEILQKEIEFFGNPENAPSIAPEPDSSSSVAFLNNTHFYFYDIVSVTKMPMKSKSRKGIEISKKPIRSLLQMPIRDRNKPIGILQLWSFKKNIFLEENDLELIANICSFIPSVLKNSELFLTVENQKRELESKNSELKEKNDIISDQIWFLGQIYELARAVNSSLDFNRVMKILINNLRLMFGFEIIMLYLIDPDKKTLVPSKIDILGMEDWKVEELYTRPIPLHLDEKGVNAQVLRSGRTFYYENGEEDKFNFLSSGEQEEMNLLDQKSLLIVPLIIQNEMIGLLHLGTYTRKAMISEEDITQIETFVSIVATGVNNARIYETMIREKKWIENYNQQMKEEMFLARKIQLGLIPQTLPDKENIAFEHLYEPMEEIGGDFYDFIDFENPEKIGIFISDVAGHGVPAALITSMLNSLLDVSENLKSSPKHFLHYLNTSLIKRTHDNFLTAFYCIYDQKTRKMKYSRAGHPEPILIRNGEVITIKSRGMLLGMIPDFKVEEKEIVLFPGDKVIFYTDGITECMNRDNVRFSEKFHEILKRNHTLPISDMVQLIHEKILEHRRSTHFEDDLCLIGMEAF